MLSKIMPIFTVLLMITLISCDKDDDTVTGGGLDDDSSSAATSSTASSGGTSTSGTGSSSIASSAASSSSPAGNLVYADFNVTTPWAWAASDKEDEDPTSTSTASFSFPGASGSGKLMQFSYTLGANSLGYSYCYAYFYLNAAVEDGTEPKNTDLSGYSHIRLWIKSDGSTDVEIHLATEGMTPKSDSYALITPTGSWQEEVIDLTALTNAGNRQPVVLSDVDSMSVAVSGDGSTTETAVVYIDDITFQTNNATVGGAQPPDGTHP